MSYFNKLEFFRKSLWYGDGSLGNVDTASTQTFTGDRSYNNLTLQAGARFILNGWRLFVKDTLTFVTADAGTISASGNSGATAVDHLGGLGGVAGNYGHFRGGTAGGLGGYGSVGEGATGAATQTYDCVGGRGGGGGAGGSASWPGGIAVASVSPTATYLPRTPGHHLLKGTSTLYVGMGGVGGSGGGGDNTYTGGGGGGGGAGGGAAFIYARKIQFVTCSNSGVISVNGGTGGNGRVGSSPGPAGGGGGGGGGSAGYVQLVCDHVLGTSLAAAVTLNGGDGGDGAAGTSTGTAGAGGYGGSVGSFLYVCFGKNIVTVGETDKVLGSPDGVAGGLGLTMDFTL
jgi:hypothetical protein